MADDITNKMLLEHIQAMNYDLQTQIHSLKDDMVGRFATIDGRFTAIDGRFTTLEKQVQRGFQETREHLQALQEDLDATMRLQSKHGKKLARL